MTDLRATLQRLADSAEPLPVADDLWARGQASRRRGQALVVAAVLAIIASVTWSAVLLGSDDREARTASTDVVPGGAIPSRINDPGDLPLEGDLAVGRVSVAFTGSDGHPVVVTADDGRYHALDLTGWDHGLVSVSPDGSTLAWTIESDAEGRPREGFALLDLTSGRVRLMSSGSVGSLTPEGLSWSPSGQWLTWFVDDDVSRTQIGAGRQETTVIGKQVQWSAVDDQGVITFYAQGPRRWSQDRVHERIKTSEDTSVDIGRRGHSAAVASPSGDAVALVSNGDTAAVDFLMGGRFEERALATDLYPDGASVRPLGWASDTLVVAQVDGADGSYVEGSHLALLTAPNAPESEWTYRIVARDIPDRAISVAVDLIPDLDGTSSQQLTHDFGDPLGSDQRDLSWIIGLGVAAAIGVLLALRWLLRRLLG
ncbi:hypothetical protein EUA93_05185 [Nocardioides oleivorans]|uniref:WD40 repeat domain-containing protein n=1 Tax=Nocardioides oleivorans TaxID=273676 RepID=A0A4Q2S0C6_9ACTN|nr:hypothetical protein [Nocardioides oleivorans]RYB93805.1 hypothetical protein EUA93_05185 [Nocardioides oleivorans]